jgi:energy-coupling factor transporter ATP-binding protein EcfA2
MIKIEHLNYQYSDGEQGVNDISIEINPSTALAILGSNGCGKSTLLKCLMGILKPQSGSITINNQNIDKLSITQRSKYIGFVFQDTREQLFNFTIEQEIRFALRTRKDQEDIESKLDAILELCSLTAHRNKHPYDVSMSQQKFILIGCALGMNQDIIIMDEPTSGMDYQGIKQLAKIVEFLKKEKKTIIMVSHDLNFVSEHFEHVMIINRHHCIYQGTFKEACQYENVLNQGEYELPDIARLSLKARNHLCTTHQEWIELWTKK